jgi:hypothetical protein
MSSNSGLLDLPNELLLPILDELPDDQLLSIAFLSRRLHLLALPIHLCRLKILDDSANYSSCNITLSWSSFSALPTLRKALFIESIKHLTCEFPCTSTGAVDDIFAMNSFVSRLTSVSEASLLFRGIYIRQPSIPLEKWTSAFSELLRTLVEKSCTTVRFRHADAPAGAFGSGGGGLFKGERKKFHILSRPFDAIRTMHKSRFALLNILSSYSLTIPFLQQRPRETHILQSPSCAFPACRTELVADYPSVCRIHGYHCQSLV